MSDKSFELMEKMYVEFSKKFASLESGQNEITQRLDSLEAGQKKLETILEHDIKTKLQAVYERASDNTDKLEEHTERLETIENKIDILAMSINSQDKRLEVVESKRKKAK